MAQPAQAPCLSDEQSRSEEIARLNELRSIHRLRRTP